MARASHSNGAGRWRYLALLVAAAGAAVYANTLWNGFVYDDRNQVLENPWLPDLRNLGKVFTSDVWAFEGKASAYYRPVMLLSYMLTYRVSGLEPWGYHAVNVVLHAAACALVFALAAALLRRAGHEPSAAAVPALAAGLVFATHPALTESVAWVACVPELSYTVFFLLALLLYVMAGRARGAAYAGSVAAFCAALLCKEPAILLPAVLLVHDLVFPPPDRAPGALIRRYAPFALAAAAYLAIRQAVLPAEGVMRSHRELTAWQGVVNALALFARYLATLVAPLDLNAYHLLRPVMTFASPAGALSLLAAALFVAAAVLAWHRFRPALLGLALVALPLLPVLYAPLLAGENTFTERYLYLPAAGLALLVAFGLAALLRRRPVWRPALLGLVGVLVAAFSVATVRRNLVWRSDESLWTVTAAQSPHSAVARNELGVVLMHRGLQQAAEGQFREALRLVPSMSSAHYNLALALEGQQRPDEAIAEYRRALEGDQPTAEAWNNLGEALLRQGQPESAISCYLAALRLRPSALNARLNLGRAYDELGRHEEGMVQYQAAVQARPDSPDAHLAIGIAYGRRGDLGRAVESLQVAARLGPDDPIVLRNLANALRLSGLMTEAEAALGRAVALEQRGSAR
jgi:tetratricopeptide (TPR) repeat protein